MAVGNILGQHPEVKTVNGNEANVAGNVELNAQNTDFVSATAPVLKGNADMGGYAVKNVKAPAENSDAVNLKYFNENIPNMALLWSNPNPKKQFRPQTINIDLSAYDAIVIDSTIWYQVDEILSTFAMMNTPVRLFGCDTEVLAYRDASVTPTGVAFEAGHSQETISSGFSTENLSLIPYRIWGIKFGSKV